MANPSVRAGIGLIPPGKNEMSNNRCTISLEHDKTSNTPLEAEILKLIISTVDSEKTKESSDYYVTNNGYCIC